MTALYILRDIAAGKCALRKPDWENGQITIRKLIYKLQVNGVVDHIGKQVCEDYIRLVASEAKVDDSTISLSIEQGFATHFDTDTRHIDLRQWVPGLKRQSGSEYAGACPKCTGDDRFHLKLTSNGWLCFCRQCTGADNRWMDAIDFLQWRDGLDFKSACQVLALPGVAPMNGSRQLPTETAYQKLEKSNDAWLVKIAEHCANLLRPEDLSYLEGRGISENLAREVQLGFSSGGQIMGKYVPRGITIPCWDHDEVAYIKVRTDAGYKQVAGGHAALYIARSSGHFAIVTETELDALMLAARANFCEIDTAVYATGSVSWNYDSASMLRQRHTLFTAFDNDEAGQDAAGKWGQPVLKFDGKDVGDLYQSGGWEGIDALFSQFIPPKAKEDSSKSLDYVEELLAGADVGLVNTERGIIDTKPDGKSLVQATFIDIGNGKTIPF